MTSTSDDAIAADSSKKSVDLARKELSAILGKIDGLRLPVKAWRLLRARSRLRPAKLMKVRARHLWLLLLIATWIAVQVAWTYVLAYRYSKVRHKFHGAPIIHVFPSRRDTWPPSTSDSILIPGLDATRYGPRISQGRLFLLIQVN